MSNELINFEHKGVPDPDFKLRYISISKYEGDWQSHPHTHQFSELFYVISGKGIFYIENDTVSVCADDLIIINPHIEHTEKTMSNDPMTYIVFGVEGLAFYFNSQNAANAKGYSYYNYGSAKTHFINFSQIMIKEFNARKPGFEAICHGLLQVLLVYITREQHLSVISDATLQISKECFVAKKYIDANYAKNITLDLLAEITHINKFYLSHSFTEYVGTSPINYLMETRLAASKELLLSSSRSIAEVASSTGFSSQSYFSQIFRKNTGMSPMQYRKLKQTDSKPMQDDSYYI